ncbi:hypothetical protein WNY37_11475 [Henriciella sp. AS95]|uniref:hypothetical protein n=1 Tax=Henriciella sp. AS95 TaxID=3135782 RepID=UPI0031801E00
MRRGLIAVVVILVGWFAFKNLIYTSMIGRTEGTPPAPDYFYDEAWLERPAELPPGGWATPWGVDFFVIAPPPTTPAPAGIIRADDDVIHQSYDAFVSEVGLDTSDLEIYAPSYRSPSPALAAKSRSEAMKLAETDVIDGMARYLSTDNRKRGLIILAAPGTESLLTAALGTLPDDEDFGQRFGGVVMSSDADTGAFMPALGNCSPAVDPCAVSADLVANASAMRFVLPSLPSPQMTYSSSEDLSSTLHKRAETLAEWLDANAVKPAEPFDTWAADEVVDVAPIRRPNQDEDISGDRGD